jgi:hypothetical protein
VEKKVRGQAATALLTGAANALFMLGCHADAREAFREGIICPDGIGNAFIHLRLGQVAVELGDSDRAKDELARAYMGGGDEIFANEDPKYWILLVRFSVLQRRRSVSEPLRLRNPNSRDAARVRQGDGT